MKINRNNYESFLIDYLDGRLMPDEVAEVKTFLLNNPDIAAEFENLSLTTLTPDPVEFNDKESLKKKIHELIPAPYTDMDEFLVARLEGDLSPSDFDLSEKIIKISKTVESEYHLLLQSRLSPDKNIVFKQKSSLKRSFIPILTQKQFRIAASFSVAALLTISFLFINRNLFTQDAIPLAVNKNSVTHYNNYSENPVGADNLPDRQNENSLSEKDIKIAELKTEKPTDMPSITKTDFSPMVLPTANQQPVEIAFNEELNKRNYAIIIETNNEIVQPVYTIDEYLLKQFRKQVLKETKEQYEQRKFSGWDVVDAGLQRLGKLVGKDWRLQKEYNDEGRLTNLAFHGGMFSIEYPLTKNNR